MSLIRTLCLLLYSIADHFVIIPNEHASSGQTEPIINGNPAAELASKPSKGHAARRRSTIPRLKKKKSIQERVEFYQLSVLSTDEDTDENATNLKEVC